MFKSVLCLNGNLPDKDKILKLSKNIPIIAADGAANNLIQNDIKPNIIIGDLDSLDTKLDLSSSNVIKVEDQNSTDFEKSLNYIKAQILYPTLVLGINGGEIDYILDNTNKFIKYSTDISMAFFDSPNKWGIAIQKEIAIKTKKSSTVSIFPFQENTYLKSSGLHWEINSGNHTIFKNTSTRNKTIGSNLTLSTTKDKVLVIVESESMPYTF